MAKDNARDLVQALKAGRTVKKLIEYVTVEKEVTGVIRDLVLFVHYLRENSPGVSIEKLKDDELCRTARDYCRKYQIKE